MPSPTPRNPDWQANVREVFARQNMMAHLGIGIAEMAPGMVALRAPIVPEVTQHNGFAHAGLAFAMGDNAQGMAAYTLLEPGQGILTIEMKINLLSPAVGEALLARGHVLRAGRRVVVTRADVFALKDGEEKLAAVLLGTMSVM